jgi:hypothetical protein
MNFPNFIGLVYLVTWETWKSSSKSSLSEELSGKEPIWYHGSGYFLKCLSVRNAIK